MKFTSETRADRSRVERRYTVNRVIHWVTVAMVGALVLSASVGHIDPHGPGNGAFLWHSLMGYAVYLLSASRLFLWLLAAPLSGVFLALGEGAQSALVTIPALPQWYHHGAILHPATAPDSSVILALRRIHSWLAVLLLVVISLHFIDAVRARRRR